jgi:gliding motility-associated-like protein
VFNGSLLTGGDYQFEYTTDPMGPCGSTTNIITVTVKENPVINFHATVVEGCTPLATQLVNDTDFDLATDCEWVFGDGTTSTNCAGLNLNLTEVGCYGATLTMTNDGCSASLTIGDIICVRPLPIANFDYSPTTIYSDNPLVTFTNFSEGYVNSFWDFEDGYISGDDSPEHLFDPNFATNYTVGLWVTNEYGCIDSTFRQIVINDEPLFYVPNAFTPDSDDKNPVFKPIMTAGYDPYDYHLSIYNRWGEVVFESFDAFYGWDGSYGGNIVQSGVYVWTIEFGDQLTDKNYQYRGHVTVLK